MFHQPRHHGLLPAYLQQTTFQTSPEYTNLLSNCLDCPLSASIRTSVSHWRVLQRGGFRPPSLDLLLDTFQRWLTVTLQNRLRVFLKSLIISSAPCSWVRPFSGNHMSKQHLRSRISGDLDCDSRRPPPPNSSVPHPAVGEVCPESSPQRMKDTKREGNGRGVTLCCSISHFQAPARCPGTPRRSIPHTSHGPTRNSSSTSRFTSPAGGKPTSLQQRQPSSGKRCPPSGISFSGRSPRAPLVNVTLCPASQIRATLISGVWTSVTCIFKTQRCPSSLVTFTSFSPVRHHVPVCGNVLDSIPTASGWLHLELRGHPVRCDILRGSRIHSNPQVLSLLVRHRVHLHHLGVLLPLWRDRPLQSGRRSELLMAQSLLERCFEGNTVFSSCSSPVSPGRDDPAA